MFVDASALVAILLREKDGAAFARVLDDQSDEGHVTNPIAFWETAAALMRRRNISAAEADSLVNDLLVAANIAILPITDREIRSALSAFHNFGRHKYPESERNKGLNLADCFHFATAKGDDGRILTLDAGFSAAGLSVEPSDK